MAYVSYSKLIGTMLLGFRSQFQGIATIFPEDGSIKPWQQWDGLKQQIETRRSKHRILLFILSENIQLLNIYIFSKVLHSVDAGSLKAAI
jgi:hypothetical protein